MNDFNFAMIRPTETQQSLVVFDRIGKRGRGIGLLWALSFYLLIVPLAHAQGGGEPLDEEAEQQVPLAQTEQAASGAASEKNSPNPASDSAPLEENSPQNETPKIAREPADGSTEDVDASPPLADASAASETAPTEDSDKVIGTDQSSARAQEPATANTVKGQNVDLTTNYTRRPKPAPGSADIYLEWRVGQLLLTDSSVDAIQNADTAEGVQAAIGSTFGLGIEGLRFLAIGRLYFGDIVDRFGSTDSQGVQMVWSRAALYGAAEYGPVLWDFLQPYARTGVGYVTDELEVRSDDDVISFGGSSSLDLSDRLHRLGLLGALGLRLIVQGGWLEPYAPALMTSRMSFGLNSQLAYLWQTGGAFDELQPSEDSGLGDSSWSQEPLDYGALQTNGLAWDVGVFFAYAF